MKTQNACALVGLVTAMVLASTGSARAATWTQKADMPTARWGLSTSLVDGKIYAIGGLGGSKKVEEYNPATDTWTEKADMLTGRTWLAASAVDGKIFAIGGDTTWPGGTTIATVEEYDPATDTWMQKADMPAPRGAFSTSVVNGKIYAIGGYHTHFGSPLRTVEEYDPATDTWTQKADMPTARNWLTTTVVDGKIYAVGGLLTGTGLGPPTVEEYDPEEDTWTKKADMPEPGNVLTSVVDEKIYAFGGTTRRGRMGLPNSRLIQYDPATDTWTTEDDMPVRMGGMGTNVVGRRIYVIGGTSAPYPYSPYVSTVWEFIPSPEFDFNEDGIVDAQDMTIMVDHWHTDTLRYDLAPAPAGDGIVDVLDLIALAEHMVEGRTIAHWKLDETDGDVAYDSVGGNDAVVIGDAMWQPEAGLVGGAFQFYGIDGYLSAPFILDPSKQPYSATLWIKGGQPRQTIISQQGAFGDWLYLDAAGTLTSSLLSPLPPVTSDVVITDDQWHHIGLVVDGSGISLYVDDAEVARTDITPFFAAKGDLHIGAGNNLAPGTFWSGMIDDVRIYDRAVAP